ncbi:hypothetical protein K3N28_06225 [Glycomyces sp. TRM65418]|uniref:hypothetical protein n=1 Tax=Glycomyces sp. TRM65418 TaxID=2867006 RepID=UPI001CE69E8B|nr:hypothetical protein [Glycomyces sp. TRM65418]MCC3762664.1 hypothetical protein [Glycomyces sp. TRM65418]QZD56700.1 hypothetical protein K3N28_06175 [Glycomyces sp. TRM65418]
MLQSLPHREDGDSTSSNPFPGADKQVWSRNFSNALHVATGLPLAITDTVAVYVVHPKTYLTRARASQAFEYQLRDDVVAVDLYGHKIIEVTVHGFAGGPGEYNERIRSAFDAPIRRNAVDARTLPALVTGVDENGKPSAYLTTSQSVDSTKLSNLIDITDEALRRADGRRGYSLQDDLATFGQHETTLHAVLDRHLRETDDAGHTQVRHVIDLTAIKGANRSRARQLLFDLSMKDVVYGVERNRLGLEGHGRIADPTVWVPAFANQIKLAFEQSQHPLHQTAVKAAAVATVKMQIIVGTESGDDFHNQVFDPNRVDHRRPPLDYDVLDKSESDMRAVLRELKQRGWLTEAARAWLAGEGPDPQSYPDEDFVSARDRRDCELYAAAFPQDPDKAAAVRHVLGEPARTHTTQDHMRNRLRMLSSAISAGYRHRWNPRVIDGLRPAKFLKQGGNLTEVPAWRSVLDELQHTPKDDLLHEFLTTRGIHWLAEFEIIEADRGSMEAQSREGEDVNGDTLTDKKVRRSAINARAAMLANPTRAIALLRELARAANEGDRPRQIDTDGQVSPGTVADKWWFDQTFPKFKGRRRPKLDWETSTDPTEPQAPPPNPLANLMQARSDLYTMVTDVLPNDMVDGFKRVQEVLNNATNAERIPLADAPEEEFSALLEALSVLSTDLQTLTSAVTSMRFTGLELKDSACERYLTRGADQE